MNVILDIDVKVEKIKSNTIFGIEILPIRVISLKEPKTGDVLFKFDTLGEILFHTKQLKCVQKELMQLTKDMVNMNRSEIDWAVQVAPMIKNAKKRIIVM